MKLPTALLFSVVSLLACSQARAEDLSDDTKAMLAAKFNADERLAQQCEQLHPGFGAAYDDQFAVLEPQLDNIGVHRQFRSAVAKRPGWEYTRDLDAFKAADPRGRYARCMNLLIEIQQNALKRK